MNDILGNPPACAGRGGDPEIVREAQRRRFANVEQVDKVIELDNEWRDGVPFSNL